VGQNTYFVTVEKPGYERQETPRLDFTKAKEPQVAATDVRLRKIRT